MSNENSRSESRATALEFLYQAGIRDASPIEMFEEIESEDEFVRSLLKSLESKSDQVESLIEANLSDGWALSRIPAVDLGILSLGIVELQMGETPHAVVLSEATKLAFSYSTEESAKFVNGLLASIAAELEA